MVAKLDNFRQFYDICRLKNRILEMGNRISGCIVTLMTLAITIMMSSCGKSPWSKQESRLINKPGKTMEVLTIKDREDSLTLRKTSLPLTEEMIVSESYNTLCDKMIETVSSPEQDGVGIAGPQVGISRRIVAVQRFDKEGKPFEVYPNIRITARRGAKSNGKEGCLSVPDCSGDVSRFQDIQITYTSVRTLKDTTERIKGFTAVIFQHECDHLDGILYTDYLNVQPNKKNNMKIILDVENGTERRVSATPEGVCSRQIDIVLENDIIKSVVYAGGCDGNLKGIGSLLKGMKRTDAISKLKGITCGRKQTSCPDQLALTLEALEK